MSTIAASPPPAPDAPRLLSADQCAAHADRRVGDSESRRWVQALRARGRQRDDAAERLHGLLVRAARFEVARRGLTAGDCRSDSDELAERAADDALAAIVTRLDTYRADSCFTTWAYKFVLRDIAVKLHAQPWRDRDIPVESDGWAQLLATASADRVGTTNLPELINAIHVAATDVLTPQQRAVLAAIILNDVPIDVLAERFGTSRGAVYQTLHDARQALRARLTTNGFAPLSSDMPPGHLVDGDVVLG